MSARRQRQEEMEKKSFEVLERGFNLRLSNLTGSHAENLENQAAFMKRRTNFTIPMYDSYFDHHLRKFHSSSKVCNQAPLKFSKVRGLIAPQGSSSSSASSPHRMTQSLPLLRVASTQHVLDLKAYFLKEARESPLVPACRDPMCCAYQANITGAQEMVHALPYNRTFPDILNCGLNVSNSHYRLHGAHPNVFPSKAMTDMIVIKWTEGKKEGVPHVDWPTFLLLCTVDFRAQTRDLLSFHDSYEMYCQAKPIRSETDFQKMLLYLSGAFYKNDPHSIATFPNLFQSSDYYTARHTCSFSEIIQSLQPLTEQSYIMKANARGMKLDVNFQGHTAPGNIGGPAPRRPPTAVSDSGHHNNFNPMNLGGSFSSSNRVASASPTQVATKSLRYHKKIFVV